MKTVPTTAGKVRSEEEGAAQRRCVATGELFPRSRLVRFVLDGDGRVTPDISEKLPGRGIWVRASRPALRLAADKNLFSRAAKAKVKVAVPPDLSDVVASLLQRRCLEILGLAKSSGVVVLGQPQIEQAIKSDEIDFVLVADGAGADGMKKLGKAETIRCGFSRAEMARSLGRDDAVYAGLKRHRLAETLRAELARLRGMAEDDVEIDETLKAGDPANGRKI